MNTMLQVTLFAGLFVLSQAQTLTTKFFATVYGDQYGSPYPVNAPLNWNLFTFKLPTSSTTNSLYSPYTTNFYDSLRIQQLNIGVGNTYWVWHYGKVDSQVAFVQDNQAWFESIITTQHAVYGSVNKLLDFSGRMAFWQYYSSPATGTVKVYFGTLTTKPGGDSGGDSGDDINNFINNFVCDMSAQCCTDYSALYTTMLGLFDDNSNSNIECSDVDAFLGALTDLEACNLPTLSNVPIESLTVTEFCAAAAAAAATAEESDDPFVVCINAYCSCTSAATTCNAATSDCKVAGTCNQAGVCSEETNAADDTPCVDGNDDTINGVCTSGSCAVCDMSAQCCTDYDAAWTTLQGLIADSNIECSDVDTFLGSLTILEDCNLPTLSSDVPIESLTVTDFCAAAAAETEESDDSFVVCINAYCSCTSAATTCNAATSDCKVAGTCNQAGVCSEETNVADDTTCDDGNADTVGDVCTSGLCAGTDKSTAGHIKAFVAISVIAIAVWMF